MTKFRNVSKPELQAPVVYEILSAFRGDLTKLIEAVTEMSSKLISFETFWSIFSTNMFLKCKVGQSILLNFTF